MGTEANWPYKAGEKGRNRVRAFERPSGIIYLEYWEHDERKRISTGHRDREKAKRQADELAAKFARGLPDEESGVTLRELFDKYRAKRTPQVGERQQRHHHRCAELFLRYWGWDRKVASLNRRDWDDFIHDRGSGRIDARGYEVPEEDRRSVGPRRVQEDLQALRAACNWAVQADLLPSNPVAGYPLPREKNPNRPRLSQERYEAMLKVASEVDWRFEVALVLANETGHRSKAIRRLRWSDIDLTEQTVRWREEEDKSGHEHVTPLTEEAVTALRRAQQRRAGIGEARVLPAPVDQSEPVSRHLLRDWWYRAEEFAELEHIEGLGWHGLRRKFADELREVPLKDLARLGGWQTEQTILKCYMEADLDSMRRAQEQRLTLQERSAGGE